MDAKKPQDNRPLSPFMIGPYYKPQLTSMLSITHRATGMALAFGSAFLVLWLVAAARGPVSYAEFQVHAQSWYGTLLMVGWTWALFYHFCNGLRHLWWDIGKGYEMKSVYLSGYLSVAASFIMTAGVWLAACAK